MTQVWFQKKRRGQEGGGSREKDIQYVVDVKGVVDLRKKMTRRRTPVS